MSLLIVELVPQGIIFGADRNISVESKKIVYEDKGEERPFIEQHHYHFYQSPRPKVLRWPQRKALIGYVGEADIGGATDEWLYDFIGDNLNFESFKTLAESLRQRVQEQYRIEKERHYVESDNKFLPLIIHLGGFEEKEGVQVPAVWVIRNDHNPPHLEDIREEFEAVECVWSALSSAAITPQNISAYLTARAVAFDPFWFHQTGIEHLGTFNLLEAFLKAALRELSLNKLIDEQGPQTLEDWKRQVRMSILMYSGYIQAYKEPYEQDVGGGADVVAISWPEPLAASQV